MLKVALRHFLNPSFRLLGSVMILPACTFKQQPPFSSPWKPSARARSQLPLDLCLWQHAHPTSHISRRGEQNERGTHPAAFSSPKSSGWHVPDLPTQSLTTGWRLRCLNRQSISARLPSQYAGCICQISVWEFSTQLKKRWRVRFCYDLPADSPCIPCYAAAPASVAPLAHGDFWLAANGARISALQYKQLVLIIWNIMNQPKIIAHYQSPTTYTNCKSLETQLAAECKRLSVRV